MALVNDPHSFLEPGMPVMVHVALNLNFQFHRREIEGIATITFDRAGTTMLDTRDLFIDAVHDGGSVDGEVLDWRMGQARGKLGVPLHLDVPDSLKVRVKYHTSPTASGLHWLPAELTAGKRHPMVYTQGQCINARTYLPCQDSPGVRFTIEARMHAPSWAKSLMVGKCTQDHSWSDPWHSYYWEMTHPIPAYLFAFAVGDFVEHDISDRIRVYAEPELIDRAAYEFAGAEEILKRAEGLFGRFRWDRFDLLLLPPSFPYGGMENPELTFLSPTILAGDRSQIDVLDHESGHFWFGNLVTNATWCDFWLNEGWTTYAQWRLREAADGTEAMLLEMAVERRELEFSMQRWRKLGKSHWNALYVDLGPDVDPEETVSSVPYVRGALFLYAIECVVGRERFDRFALTYIERFAFRSVSTQRFLDFVEEQLPGVLAAVDADAWIDGHELPGNIPIIRSVMVEEVFEAAEKGTNTFATDISANWHPKQWQLYLELLAERDDIDAGYVRRLDAVHKLSICANMDVRAAFLRLAAKHCWQQFVVPIVALLATVGRIKYIKLVTSALCENPDGLDWFETVFGEARANHHPITIKAVERIVKEARKPEEGQKADKPAAA